MPFTDDARAGYDRLRRQRTGMDDKELEELTGYTGVR